jgi:hypothetical protein
MTAYDLAAWTDFANTAAGGAAALAGLLFVGLSMNLAEVLKYPGVPARAAVTLGLTVAILLTAIFVATPGQDHRVLGRRGRRGRPRDGGRRDCRSAATAVGPASGARADVDAATWSPGTAGGLYWVTAAVATGFVSATANAWVLLVEIKR